MPQYNRQKAVEYAHKWAFGRNPAYLNFENIGGDCTNFISQCLYAGAGVMNYTPDYGWYYIDANRRAPAWTGVSFLYNFLTRNEQNAGPYATVVPLSDLVPGDIIQLSFGNGVFQHSLLVVDKGRGTPDTVLIACHTYDSDYRPVSTYTFEKMRCLHIAGVR